MNFLLIPLVLAGIFIFPFAMARLEPKPRQAPTHRATTGQRLSDKQRSVSINERDTARR